MICGLQKLVFQDEDLISLYDNFIEEAYAIASGFSSRERMQTENALHDL